MKTLTDNTASHNSEQKEYLGSKVYKVANVVLGLNRILVLGIRNGARNTKLEIETISFNL